MEFLVSQGHSPSEVFRYTLKQFRAFVSLAWGRVKQEYSVLARINRLVYHGEAESFEEFMHDLER